MKESDSFDLVINASDGTNTANVSTSSIRFE